MRAGREVNLNTRNMGPMTAKVVGGHGSDRWVIKQVLPEDKYELVKGGVCIEVYSSQFTPVLVSTLPPCRMTDYIAKCPKGPVYPIWLPADGKWESWKVAVCMQLPGHLLVLSWGPEGTAGNGFKATQYIGVFPQITQGKKMFLENALQMPEEQDQVLRVLLVMAQKLPGSGASFLVGNDLVIKGLADWVEEQGVSIEGWCPSDWIMHE